MPTHSSIKTSNGHGNWTVECWVCHNQHLQEQNRYNGSTYGKFIRRSINLANIIGGDGNPLPDKSGTKSVVFKGQTGANSFADGDGAYDGICEVCHTRTTHFRNDGSGSEQNHCGKEGTVCTACHKHESGFKSVGPAHSWLLKNGTYCESCHDPDGTTDIVEEIHKGNCGDCHDLCDYSLRTGTKGDATLHGATGVGNTSSCTTCHPGATYPITEIHHGTVSAPSAHANVGDCEHCHADPRPSSPLWNASAPGDNGMYAGNDVPTQLACRECHVAYSGGQMIIRKFTRANYDSYATDWSKTIQHAIPNTASRIDNFGICFSCHNGAKAIGITVWHARPDKLSPTWIFGEMNTANCTGSSAAEVWGDPPAAGLARYAAGRTSGTIGRFNLFKVPGFGYYPTVGDYGSCSDADLYSTSPLAFSRITVPAVAGNGNTSDAVPVFPSLVPLADLPADAVAYWSFEEGSGGTAYDGMDVNPGHLSASAVWESQGRIGGGIRADALNANIAVYDSPSLYFGTGSFSIEAWLKPSTFVSVDAPTYVRWYQRSNWCVDWTTNPACNWFVAEINSSGGTRFNGRGYGDAATFSLTAGTVNLNEWSHVVIVIDRSASPAKGFIYVNGVNQSGSGAELSSLAGNLDIAGSTLHLGASWADYQGVMDEVVIYNRALTAEEVLERYQRAP